MRVLGCSLLTKNSMQILFTHRFVEEDMHNMILVMGLFDFFGGKKKKVEGNVREILSECFEVSARNARTQCDYEGKDFAVSGNSYVKEFLDGTKESLSRGNSIDALGTMKLCKMFGLDFYDILSDEHKRALARHLK